MNKIIILALLALQAFVDGALGQILSPEDELPISAFPMTILGALLVFMWYVKDSNELGYKRSRALNAGVAVLAFIGLPYYFFHSRGFKKGILYTFYMLAAFIVWALIKSSGITLVEIIQG